MKDKVIKHTLGALAAVLLTASAGHTLTLTQAEPIARNGGGSGGCNLNTNPGSARNSTFNAKIVPLLGGVDSQNAALKVISVDFRPVNAGQITALSLVQNKRIGIHEEAHRIASQGSYPKNIAVSGPKGPKFAFCSATQGIMEIGPDPKGVSATSGGGGEVEGMQTQTIGIE